VVCGAVGVLRPYFGVSAVVHDVSERSPRKVGASAKEEKAFRCLDLDKCVWTGVDPGFRVGAHGVDRLGKKFL